MNTKYYQIRECTSECASVGVIKVVDDVYPLEQIKSAIQSHLDEEIEIVGVEFFHNSLSLDIKVLKTNGETDVFEAEETWLYF